MEYTYDSLHRLTVSSVLAGTAPAGQEWGQSYIYDGFGNMKQKIGYALAQYTGFNVAMNSGTNNGGAVTVQNWLLTSTAPTCRLPN